jgi:peroxin-3
MLQPLTGYVYERRHGLTKAAGVAGAFYLIGYYVKDRLEEIRDKVNEQRAARERRVISDTGKR